MTFLLKLTKERLLTQTNKMVRQPQPQDEKCFKRFADSEQIHERNVLPGPEYSLEKPLHASTISNL